MKKLTETISGIKKQDIKAIQDAQTRLDNLTMPHWALGRLMDLALKLAGITGSITPPTTKKSIVIFAADHGVCEEKISLYPQEVTSQMVYNFVNGGAGINALARQADAAVVVVDIGVATPLDDLVKSGRIIDAKIRPGTSNIAKGPAMSREEAICAIERGIAVAEDLANQSDVFGTGEMGIGNTTASAAIVSEVTGLPPAEVTGAGTGIDNEQLKHKIEVVEQAIAVNKPNRDDGIDLLSKIGGFEIGGIAGLILGAARMRRPVLVDGFISTAGALIAAKLCPTSRDYMISSHKSMERGHIAALKHLGMNPLLDLELRLGEGTGAALAMNLVSAAARVLTNVATFGEAQVSTKA